MTQSVEEELAHYKALCAKQEGQLQEIRAAALELSSRLGTLKRSVASTSVSLDAVYEAQAKLAQRCHGQIYWLSGLKNPEPQLLKSAYGSAPYLEALPKELGLEHLAWMTRTVLEHGQSYPGDKMGRWIGFVQAGCVLHGITTVDAERDWSRSILHAAYVAAGLRVPETRDPESERKDA